MQCYLNGGTPSVICSTYHDTKPNNLLLFLFSQLSLNLVISGGHFWYSFPLCPDKAEKRMAADANSQCLTINLESG